MKSTKGVCVFPADRAPAGKPFQALPPPWCLKATSYFSSLCVVTGNVHPCGLVPRLSAAHLPRGEPTDASAHRSPCAALSFCFARLHTPLFSSLFLCKMSLQLLLSDSAASFQLCQQNTNKRQEVTATCATADFTDPSSHMESGFVCCWVHPITGSALAPSSQRGTTQGEKSPSPKPSHSCCTAALWTQRDLRTLFAEKLILNTVKLLTQGHNVNLKDSCTRSQTKAPRQRLCSLWHSYSTARQRAETPTWEPSRDMAGRDVTPLIHPPDCGCTMACSL